jgi:hypothetical protein
VVGILLDQINYRPDLLVKQYQEINKTTRYRFFEMVVKDVICSGILPENQISAG